MATTPDERLDEIRRRLDRLEAKTQRGSAEARAHMQRDLDALEEELAAARASADRRSDTVDESLDRLVHELSIAEHRLLVEMVDDRAQFPDAFDMVLADWDAYLDRMRTRREAHVAELRQSRTALAAELADARAKPADDWHEARDRLLAGLDDLKRKADADFRDR